MARNRILILSTALSGGGAEAIAKLMVEKLEGSSCVLFENDARIIVPAVEVRVILAQKKINLLNVLLVNFWRLVVIQWVKLKLRPMVTISHLEGPNFLNVLTKFGGRKILFVHNRVSQSYQSDIRADKAKLRLARALYHRADKIIGVSKGVCEELVESFNVDRRKVLFIQNPVDRLAVWERSQERYGDFRDLFLKEDYLINVASLTTQKNQEFLLRMFHQLVSENKECNAVKLIILGDGDQRTLLHDLCDKLELSFFDPNINSSHQYAQVCFLGFEANPYRLIKHARLLVMTSRWEGLPIALLESMSLGVPGVVADCSEGIRSAWEVPLDQQNIEKPEICHWTPYGALINGIDNDSDTIHIWTTAIRLLLHDKVLHEKCSHASRARVKDYDVSKIVEIWKRELLMPD